MASTPTMNGVHVMDEGTYNKIIDGVLKGGTSRDLTFAEIERDNSDQVIAMQQRLIDQLQQVVTLQRQKITSLESAIAMFKDELSASQSGAEAVPALSTGASS